MINALASGPPRAPGGAGLCGHPLPRSRRLYSLPLAQPVYLDLRQWALRRTYGSRCQSRGSSPRPPSSVASSHLNKADRLRASRGNCCRGRTFGQAICRLRWCWAQSMLRSKTAVTEGVRDGG
jgi:hypothetical protein